MAHIRAFHLFILGLMLSVSQSSFAQAAAASGIDSLFDAVNISGIATKVMALAVVIVGIALVIKGPSLVKRLIAKI